LNINFQFLIFHNLSEEYLILFQIHYIIEIIQKNNDQHFTLAISTSFEITLPNMFTFQYDLDYYKIQKSIKFTQLFYETLKKH
jgi:hypothetical protein